MRSVSVLLALVFVEASAYIWPNQYDVLEDIYTVTSGFADGGILDGVDPCSLSPFGGRLPGRQAASEWLRLCVNVQENTIDSIHNCLNLEPTMIWQHTMSRRALEVWTRQLGLRRTDLRTSAAL